MARPLKKGLGYFPLDTNILSDRKIRRLSQRYGCQGICTYVALLCEIYGENGYYVNCDADFRFDIAFTIGIEEEVVREVIDYCVQIRLFDSDLYEYRQILTAASVQRRYREVFRRNQPHILPELDLTQTPSVGGISVSGTTVSATDTPVSVSETPVSAAKTPRKGKGNKKEKEKTTKKKLKRNTEDETSTENRLSGVDIDDANVRQAELARMAANATAGR